MPEAELKAVIFDKDRTLLIPELSKRERWERSRLGLKGRRYSHPAIEGKVIEIEALSFWHRESRLRRGTTALLRLLQAEGIQCGIATGDFDEATLEFVVKAGIAGCFHPKGIIGADSTDFLKPDPLHFQQIAENMGVKPEECVMIGDDLYNDIEGANNAGMRTVLVRYHRYDRRELHKVRPNLIVRGFRGLTIDKLRRLWW